MKKISKLLLIVGLMLVTNHAYAWWLANTEVETSSDEIRVIITNDRDSQAHCEGNLYGRRASGQVVTHWISEEVPANDRVEVSVSNENPRDGFISGQANLMCR